MGSNPGYLLKSFYTFINKLKSEQYNYSVHANEKSSFISDQILSLVSNMQFVSVLNKIKKIIW